MYWLIDDAELKAAEGFEGVEIEPTESSSGDKCHYDIRNVKDKKAGKFASVSLKKSLFICDKDCKATQVTEEEYSKIGDMYADGVSP
ncbi:hypothetical protein [Telluribacter sp.]|jgi:hypothetical protein|uniref:hypothetical protein n=1 Tax=Telluribacter sp. TaxID=1978767 RepID=UPI002E13C64E|nr:hypothetical protein [Telluribacter sp.]